MKKFITICIVMLFPLATLLAQTSKAVISPISDTAIAKPDTFNTTDAKGMKQRFWEEKTDNTTTKGWYRNNLKEGQWLTYGQNGIITKVENYHKGMKNGAVIEIDQRGYLSSEAFYVNDIPEGIAKRYYYGTNLASVIPYKHGKVDGKKIIYYENSAGKMQEEATFRNDIKDGPSNWYTITGDKVAEYNYMNGNLEGMQRQYYPKSVLMSEQNYIKNVPQGEYKEYFESGKPKYQGIYVNGEKDGKWNEFDENGTIIKTSKFLKGVEK
ncbi:MAG TPA: toxin-antitoxin system YwqK family antitoxin [Bacteroidales bacterium]|jgi:antitoxin component YwqK of YwqJK toxin-antitoxin module